MMVYEDVSINESICGEDFYFDPIDGTFVQINLHEYDEECAGSLSEQGRRDTLALVLVLVLLCIMLLMLLSTVSV